MASIIGFDEYDKMYKRIINNIEIDEELIKDEGIYINDTSLEHPLSYSDEFDVSGNFLYINRLYYEKHKDYIDNLIEDTLRCTTKDKVLLGTSEFVNERFLNAIKGNSNIKNVKLSSLKELTRKELNILLSGNYETIDCAFNFEDDNSLLYQYIPNLIIRNYPIVAGTTVSNFGSNDVSLRIDKTLSEEELARLKKLFYKYPQKEVYIKFKEDSQIKDIMSVIRSDKIKIENRIDYRKDIYQFFEDNYDNVLFKVTSKLSVTPKTLIEKEKILDNIISEINSIDNSPLEKYMYLYNVVKLFKEYKEVELGQEKMYARDSAFTLFNEYMVCVGYATLLDELVTRLNDPNVSVFSYGCNILRNDGTTVGHKRCLVKINDEKYKVNGTYISDPTWDSVTYYKKTKKRNGNTKVNYKKPLAHVDLYNHFLMTKEEVLDEKIEYADPDITDVLFSDSNSSSKDKISLFTYEAAKEAIIKFNYNKEMSKEEILKEMDKINDEPISSDTIRLAIKNLYSKIYRIDNDRINDLVEETLRYNSDTQNKLFENTNDKFKSTTTKIYLK